MQEQRNPWEVAAEARAAPSVLPPVYGQEPAIRRGRPRLPSPRYEDEAIVGQNRAGASQFDPALAAANVAKAQADAEAAAAQTARGGLTGEQAQSQTQRLARLRSATTRFLDIARLYQDQYQNNDYLISLPDALSPANEAFNSTAQAAAADLFAIARVPGVGSQSDREMQAFNDAYLLTAQRSDAANEERLNSIENFLNEQRRAAGLPPVSWRNGGGGNSSAALGRDLLPNAAPPAGPGAASQGPMGVVAPEDPSEIGVGANDPGAGRMVPDSSEQFVTNESGAAFANRVNSAYMQRAPLSQIVAMIEAHQGHPVDGDQLNNLRVAYTPVGRRRVRQRGTLMSREWYGQNEPINDGSIPGAINQARAAAANSAPGAAIAGAGDAITLGSLDEIGGVISGAGSALTGGSFDEGYNTSVDSFRANRNALSENQPLAYLGGQLVGSAVLPWNRFAPLSLQAVRSGAYGGAYGFNSAEGPVSDRLDSASAGGAIGMAARPALTAIGRGGARAFNALARRPNISPGAQGIAQAAEQEGVRISRPIVDPASRSRMAYLEATPGTNNIIREGAAGGRFRRESVGLNATARDIEARAGQLGARGVAEETGTMGQRIQDAGQRYISRSRDTRTRLYDRASNLAGDAQIVGREAVEEIDSQIANLSRNPGSNAGEVRFLQTLRGDFVDEGGNLIPKSVGDIRDLRTGLRGRINEAGLTFGQAEARVLSVLDRARNDITRDLNAANPGAVRAYARADRFNATRANEIQQVVQRVIGRRNDNLSGEQVMARVRTMASDRGDSGRLDRLWSRLSPDESRDAAATIAATAGRRSAEEEFSPAVFVNWARSLSPAARRTIFGPEGARSISNLRDLSAAYTAAQRSLNNSRSGMVQQWGALFRDFTKGGVLGSVASAATGASLLGTGGAGVAAGAGISGLGLLGRRMSARALMSPDMTRWLRAGPSAQTPAAIRAHIERLGTVAQRDPAIAQEALGLRSALMQAMNDNMVPGAQRAAASDPGQAGNE